MPNPIKALLHDWGQPIQFLLLTFWTCLKSALDCLTRLIIPVGLIYIPYMHKRKKNTHTHSFKGCDKPSTYGQHVIKWCIASTEDSLCALQVCGQLQDLWSRIRYSALLEITITESIVRVVRQLIFTIWLSLIYWQLDYLYNNLLTPVVDVCLCSVLPEQNNQSYHQECHFQMAKIYVYYRTFT